MKKIVDYIEYYAKTAPDNIITILNGKKYTYGYFWNIVEKTSKDTPLAEDGKKYFILKNTQDTEFMINYFSLHRRGIVAVPVDENISDRKYDEIDSLCSTLDFKPEDDIADILFTTGTTGKSKGVMISHAAMIANAENLIDAQGFSCKTTFVISGPLNHIGSLSKMYTTIMAGGTVVFTNGMKDMNAFLDAISEPHSATFLVPASIRMLLAFAPDRLKEKAHLLDFIETGASAMPLSDMQELCKLLPDTRLYNTYASTETGIIATHNYNSDKCIPGCLGKPMKNSDLFITTDSTVACSGKTLMSGYAGDKDLTDKVMKNGVLKTSDYGMIDEDGMLILKGRTDDIINTGGFKVAPTDVEDAAMLHPDIKDCICIALQHPILGTALKLLYVTDSPNLKPAHIAKHLKNILEPHQIPVQYEKVEKIEKTFNGKPNRKIYRQ